MASSSSFQRKSKSRVPAIPGVFPSLFTSQLLTSTGIPDLDTLLGGGLVIGSILVIIEDVSANFSRLALKYFLSEGVANRHALLVTDSSPDGKLITQSLPVFETGDPGVTEDEKKESEEKMMIAWRYQGQASTKESGMSVNNLGRRTHAFNLLKTIPSETLSQIDMSACDIDQSSDNGQWKTSAYFKVIQDLQAKVKDGGFLIDPGASEAHKNVLRVGIQSLGLSLWSDLERRRKHLPRFLYCLRATLRSCFGVAVVTLPASLFSGENFQDTALLLSDYLVSLQSFQGEEKVNEVYRDYHGLLNIHKIQGLGGLGPPNMLIQDPSQLVFKSKRTKFVIEKFHLPPDLSENVSRDNKDKTLKQTNIDF